ncbi:MAG: hypothetical protein WA093_02670 [Minisyncoccales bacterium]
MEDRSISLLYHCDKPAFGAFALHRFPSGIKTEDHFLRVLKGNEIIMAVADTHKEVYSPLHPPKFPAGDQAVLRTVIKSIRTAKAGESVLKTAIQANASVYRVLKKENEARVIAGHSLIDLNDAAQLPGAVLVIVKIDVGAKKWEMFQSCDGWCIRFNSRIKPVISPYRNARIEEYHQKTINHFLSKSAGDKGGMWDLFFDRLCESRRRENNMSAEAVIANGTKLFDVLAETQVTTGELKPKATFIIGSDGVFYDPLSFPPHREQLADWWRTNNDVKSFVKWNEDLQEQKSAGHVYEGIPEKSLLKLTMG